MLPWAHRCLRLSVTCIWRILRDVEIFYAPHHVGGNVTSMIHSYGTFEGSGTGVHRPPEQHRLQHQMDEVITHTWRGKEENIFTRTERALNFLDTWSVDDGIVQ